MDLLPWFEWFETTPIATLIRESLWAFPVIEAVHLVAFAVIGGTILLVDLRMCGFVLRKYEVSELAGDVQPFLIASLLVMIASGTAMFLSEAVKCYYSQPFWVKMAGLLLAILFTFTVRNRVAFASAGSLQPIWGRIAAVVSISLWGTVAWGGRWIGFSG
jgi:hypothetical protein